MNVAECALTSNPKTVPNEDGVYNDDTDDDDVYDDNYISAMKITMRERDG
jgi:hypothetical protein